MDLTVEVLLNLAVFGTFLAFGVQISLQQIPFFLSRHIKKATVMLAIGTCRLEFSLET